MAEIQKRMKYMRFVSRIWADDGAGIGKINGYPLFVKDALIGDVAEVKIIKTKENYAYARLMHLITPFAPSGNAPLSVASSAAAVRSRRWTMGSSCCSNSGWWKNNLRRIGGLADVGVLPVLGMDEALPVSKQIPVSHWHGQRRQSRGGLLCGTHPQHHSVQRLYAGRRRESMILVHRTGSHERLSYPAYDETTGEGLSTPCAHKGQPLPPRADGLSRSERRSTTGTGGAGRAAASHSWHDVHHGKRQPGRSNIILGNRVFLIWGKDLYYWIRSVMFLIRSPLSFYQVNPVQTQNYMKQHFLMPDLPVRRRSGICTHSIGTISSSWPEKAKEGVRCGEVFRKPLRMPEGMRNRTIFKMQSSLSENPGSIAYLLSRKTAAPRCHHSRPAAKGL